MEKNAEAIFYEAINHNKERIFRICRGYSNSFEDAQDLFQDVTLNIWRSLSSFRNESHVNTWIYRITVNVCTRSRQHYLKKEKHFRRIEGIEFPESREESTDNENLVSRLRECVSKLQESDRTLVLLFLEDLPYREIASITGLSENNVAVKIKRIKNKLLTCIKSSEHDRE